MIDGEFSSALSLGVDCRVRYQLSRHRYFHTLPPEEHDVKEFTKELYANAKTGTFFFDWLVTPTDAVIEILQSRFKGVFERENLIINKNGSVVDSRYGVVFQHAFSRADGVVTEDIIENEYERQRAKTGYLADKTLDAMKRGNVLYVIAAAPPERLIPKAMTIDRYAPNLVFVMDWGCAMSRFQASHAASMIAS
jgi:hypothetical protein